MIYKTLKKVSDDFFVTSYKTLLKASDYCQLLDKSKYPETVEIGGINFTNNGDGSFTMTGTKDGNAQLKICVADIKKGHKYLGSTGTDIFFMWFYKDGTSIYGDFISSPFYTATKTSTDVEFFIKTESSDEVDVTAYPQFFDLTEMFGAGNEPTTVEEFREKFPNELYDYKPYSIITSYKKSLVCKTKNLFDINQAINGSGENAFDTFSINNNVITATSDNSTTKIATIDIFKGELPAGDYILSLNAVIENTPKHNRPNEIFIFKNGSFLTLNNSMQTDGSYSPKINFTLSEKAEIRILFYKSVLSSQETVSDTVYKVTLSNIQLELGDTATEYHPYGYL